MTTSDIEINIHKYDGGYFDAVQIQLDLERAAGTHFATNVPSKEFEGNNGKTTFLDLVLSVPAHEWISVDDDLAEYFHKHPDMICKYKIGDKETLILKGETFTRETVSFVPPFSDKTLSVVASLDPSSASLKVETIPTSEINKRTKGYEAWLLINSMDIFGKYCDLSSAHRAEED